MICEFCKNNEANVHLIKVINGRAEKMNLCIDCLKNFAIFPTEEIFNDLTKLLTKVFEVDIKIIDKGENDKIFENVSDSENKKCPYCSIDLSTIKAIGRVGCAYCYTEFKDLLKPIIKAIHGGAEHNGKIPLISNEDIRIEKEIRDLKYRLSEEVTVENYEEAAKLRDTIKNLQKKLYIGRKSK